MYTIGWFNWMSVYLPVCPELEAIIGGSTSGSC